MIDSYSPVTRLGIQVASPFAIMVGVYLLFAGHNNPGGGFAAGLVFGAVITLRVLVGLQEPNGATELVAGGTLLMVIVSIAPLLWGGVLLDQQVIEAELPVLGKVKTGSALPFDIGVTAVVIGVVIALLDGLGGTELAKSMNQQPTADGEESP
ncbi:MAG: MnhB domain-containing protein [Actinomycetota bacterium]